MKALRFQNGTLAVEEVPKPADNGEALVKVSLSGICSTDLEIIGGYAGFEGTLGHEFVGIVESAAGAEHLVGKRVVGEINAGCGDCPNCKGNDSRHCANRTVLGIIGRDGAHAEYLSLPARNLLEVPDVVSDEEAVFAEPLAAAVGITEQVEILPESRIAVIGDGKLGNLCAQSVALKSADTILIGKHRSKLDLVKNSKVAETVLLENAGKLARDFDIVVEASGSESGFKLALDLLKPRGKLVLKSTFQGMTKVEMWRIVVEEITIIGSRCGKFAPALELLRDRKIEVENMISGEFALKEGVNAMRTAANAGVMKVLLRN